MPHLERYSARFSTFILLAFFTYLRLILLFFNVPYLKCSIKMPRFGLLVFILG